MEEEKLKQGAIVWAKVEGHQWWPGKIIRRRDVPIEVGLPLEFRLGTINDFVPILFYTPFGIPQLAYNKLVQKYLTKYQLNEFQGPQVNFDDNTSKEIQDCDPEFAWIRPDCLKIFKLGDSQTMPVVEELLPKGQNELQNVNNQLITEKDHVDQEKELQKLPQQQNQNGLQDTKPTQNNSEINNISKEMPNLQQLEQQQNDDGNTNRDIQNNVEQINSTELQKQQQKQQQDLQAPFANNENNRKLCAQMADKDLEIQLQILDSHLKKSSTNQKAALDNNSIQNDILNNATMQNKDQIEAPPGDISNQPVNNLKQSNNPPTENVKADNNTVNGPTSIGATNNEDLMANSNSSSLFQSWISLQRKENYYIGQDGYCSDSDGGWDTLTQSKYWKHTYHGDRYQNFKQQLRKKQKKSKSKTKKRRTLLNDEINEDDLNNLDNDDLQQSIMLLNSGFPIPFSNPLYQNHQIEKILFLKKSQKNNKEKDKNDEDENYEKQDKFLVKYMNLSNLHNQWLPASLVKLNVPILHRQFLEQIKSNSTLSSTKTIDEYKYIQPERLIARRKSSKGPGYEVLVKWLNQNHDQSSWEIEGTIAGTLNIAKFPKLYEVFLSSRFKALQNYFQQPQNSLQYSLNMQQLANNCASSEQLRDYLDQKHTQKSAKYGLKNNFINELRKYQTETLLKILQNYLNCQNLDSIKSAGSILGDQQGIGIDTQVLNLIYVLKYVLESSSPILITVKNAQQMDTYYWQLKRYLGNKAKVIKYSGSTQERNTIMKHEILVSDLDFQEVNVLYKYNDILNQGIGMGQGKSSREEKLNQSGKESVKPAQDVGPILADVVIAPFDIISKDFTQFRKIPWSSIIVDLQFSSLSQLLVQKLVENLSDFQVRHYQPQLQLQNASTITSQDLAKLQSSFLPYKLVITQEDLQEQSLITLLKFLYLFRDKPKRKMLEKDLLQIDTTHHEVLSDLLKIYIKTQKRDIGPLQVPKFVLDYQVNFTIRQSEWYINSIASFFEILCDDQDSNSLAEYRLIFNEILKLCQSPALSHDFSQKLEDLNLVTLMELSGKLHALDSILKNVKDNQQKCIIVSTQHSISLIQKYLHLRFGDQQYALLSQNLLNFQSDIDKQKQGLNSFNDISLSNMQANENVNQQNNNEKIHQQSNDTFILLVDALSCGPNLEVQRAEYVIMFDFEFDPYESLSNIFTIGKIGSNINQSQYVDKQQSRDVQDLSLEKTNKDIDRVSEGQVDDIVLNGIGHDSQNILEKQNSDLQNQRPDIAVDLKLIDQQVSLRFTSKQDIQALSSQEAQHQSIQELQQQKQSEQDQEVSVQMADGQQDISKDQHVINNNINQVQQSPQNLMQNDILQDAQNLYEIKDSVVIRLSTRNSMEQKILEIAKNDYEFYQYQAVQPLQHQYLKKFKQDLTQLHTLSALNSIIQFDIEKQIQKIDKQDVWKYNGGIDGKLSTSVHKINKDQDNQNNQNQIQENNGSMTQIKKQENGLPDSQAIRNEFDIDQQYMQSSKQQQSHTQQKQDQFFSLQQQWAFESLQHNDDQGGIVEAIRKLQRCSNIEEAKHIVDSIPISEDRDTLQIEDPFQNQTSIIQEDKTLLDKQLQNQKQDTHYSDLYAQKPFQRGEVITYWRSVLEDRWTILQQEESNYFKKLQNLEQQQQQQNLLDDQLQSETNLLQGPTQQQSSLQQQILQNEQDLQDNTIQKEELTQAQKQNQVQDDGRRKSRQSVWGDSNTLPQNVAQGTRKKRKSFNSDYVYNDYKGVDGNPISKQSARGKQLQAQLRQMELQNQVHNQYTPQTQSQGPFESQHNLTQQDLSNQNRNLQQSAMFQPSSKQVSQDFVQNSSGNQLQGYGANANSKAHYSQRSPIQNINFQTNQFDIVRGDKKGSMVINKRKRVGNDLVGNVQNKKQSQIQSHQTQPQQQISQLPFQQQQLNTYGAQQSLTPQHEQPVTQNLQMQNAQNNFVNPNVTVEQVQKLQTDNGFIDLLASFYQGDEMQDFGLTFKMDRDKQERIYYAMLSRLYNLQEYQKQLILERSSKQYEVLLEASEKLSKFQEILGVDNPAIADLAFQICQLYLLMPPSQKFTLYSFRTNSFNDLMLLSIFGTGFALYYNINYDPDYIYPSGPQLAQQSELYRNNQGQGSNPQFGQNTPPLPPWGGQNQAQGLKNNDTSPTGQVTRDLFLDMSEIFQVSHEKLLSLHQMSMSTILLSMLIRRKQFEQSITMEQQTQNVLSVKAWLGDDRVQQSLQFSQLRDPNYMSTIKAKLRSGFEECLPQTLLPTLDVVNEQTVNLLEVLGQVIDSTELNFKVSCFEPQQVGGTQTPLRKVWDELVSQATELGAYLDFQGRSQEQVTDYQREWDDQQLRKLMMEIEGHAKSYNQWHQQLNMFKSKSEVMKKVWEDVSRMMSQGANMLVEKLEQEAWGYHNKVFQDMINCRIQIQNYLEAVQNERQFFGGRGYPNMLISNYTIGQKFDIKRKALSRGEQDFKDANIQYQNNAGVVNQQNQKLAQNDSHPLEAFGLEHLSNQEFQKLIAPLMQRNLQQNQ